ncbi:MAG: hypothetical protein IIW19_05570, partial [Clostridia bacterium]|nr:hypothetical protein [Clostridia bacterium]
LVNGAPCSVVPKYLSSASIRISMSKDGVIYHPHGSESLIDWLNNTNNFTFDNMGEYTFTAEILRGEEVMVVSNPVTVKALPSVITLAGDLDTDLSAVLKGDPFESAIVLDGLFEDSDKDPVTVTVAEASEGIEAVKQGNQIVIRAEKTVNGVVRLLASDGHGAEKTVEIHVSVKSVADIVIPIVIGAAVLLVLAAVALVIVRKNSIVSFSFSVSTVVNYKTYTFNIQNYRNKKNAKPKVTLKTLLDVCSFCVAGDESAAKAAFAPLAGRITVKGKPFKKAFVIFVDGKKVCEYERNRERDVWVGNDGDVVTFGPV